MALAKTSKLLVVGLTIAAIALISSTLAAITINQNVASSGTIATTPNIGVYSDSSCTTNITSINWGSLAPGGTATQTVYVKNTGSGTMTLSMVVSSWTPSSASTYITVSWNQAGTQLSSGQVVAATLTLSVSSSITAVSSFSNSITFTGSG